MKNSRDDDDIPAEIDFSRGVRGKHAARYKEGVTVREAVPDPMRLYETQSRLGRALLGMQSVERALFAYLLLVTKLSVAKAAAETRKSWEKPNYYLDILCAEWPAHAASRPPVEDRLSHFLRERNWLVHQSSAQVEPVASNDDYRALSNRIEMLADEAFFFTSSLEAILERKLSGQGLSPSEIDRRTREIVDVWSAA